MTEFAVPERIASIDVGAAYRGVRHRLTELLQDCSEAEWNRTVPHCPSWTVRDTLAHVAGIVDDAINGNMNGVATEPWTAAQVAKRAERSGPEILEEWNTWAPFVEDRASSAGLALAQLVFDAASHEHDIRFALARPGGRDSDALWVGVSFAATRLGAALGPDGAPLVSLVAIDEHGTQTPLMPTGACELRATVFDIARTFGSRRTREQVLALDWSADPTEHVFGLLPFSLPTEPLAE